MSSVLAAGLVCGCSSKPASDAESSDGAAASAEPLCDGSDHLRLSYRDVPGGGPFAGAFGPFLYPLGFRYVFIDGQCRYWACNNVWQGARTGVLNDQEASALETKIHYADLPDLDGDWGQACSDSSPWFASDGSAEVSCGCGCEEDVPAELSEMGVALCEFIEDSAGSGSTHDGPMQIAAYDCTADGNGSDDGEWQLWPFARNLSDVVVESDRFDATSGLLVDDQAELAELRAFRADYVAARGLVGRGDENMQVRQDGSYYCLVVRDVVPWDPASP